MMTIAVVALSALSAGLLALCLCCCWGRLFRPAPTGRIGEGFRAVRSRGANLFLVTDGTRAICFDTGWRDRALPRELARIGIDPETITDVFLTHTDLDHTGGLRLMPRARVHLAREEKQMVDGTTPKFLWFHNPRLDRDCTWLSDGETVRIGTTTVQAILTPGHTPGHTAYLVNGSVLVTGDTLALKNGVAGTFHRLFNRSTARQRESIRRLAGLEGVTLLCTGHTGCSADFALAMRPWRETPEGNRPQGRDT